jgi:hypothetical protein
MTAQTIHAGTVTVSTRRSPLWKQGTTWLFLVLVAIAIAAFSVAAVRDPSPAAVTHVVNQAPNANTRQGRVELDGPNTNTGQRRVAVSAANEPTATTRQGRVD